MVSKKGEARAMGKAAASSPRKRSSRPRRPKEPVLVRLHAVRRKMALEKTRLGLNDGEYMEFLTARLKAQGIMK